MSKIMIIDDCDMMRQFLEMQCLEFGKVESHNTALSALEALSLNNIPDAIILDLNLPDMHGKKFLQKISETEAFRRIPVLVLSGETKIDSKIKCFELGASDYLTKPFHPGELKLRLKSQLQVLKKAV